MTQEQDKEFDFAPFRPSNPQPLTNPAKIKAMMKFASLTRTEQERIVKIKRARFEKSE